MSSQRWLSQLPHGLEGLTDLALDLRWTWSEFSDRLWQRLDAEACERTGSPYLILQSVSQARSPEATQDEALEADLQACLLERSRYLQNPGCFGHSPVANDVRGIAYFSMEFGLSEAFPIDSGGLGILAGDHLKAASDLGIPLVGVGFLNQQGFFRQVVSADSWQIEAFPYNLVFRVRGGREGLRLRSSSALGD